MRTLIEPSMRNLLRRPLVLGVPAEGLLGLSFITLTLWVLLGGTEVWANTLSAGVAIGGYGALRIVQRFSRNGWEQTLRYRVERRLKIKSRTHSKVKRSEAGQGSASDTLPVFSPDALTESELMAHKDALASSLIEIRDGDFRLYQTSYSSSGSKLRVFSEPTDRLSLPPSLHVYSLHQLPVFTDPLWLFSLITRLKALTELKGEDRIEVLTAIRGLNAEASRRKIEMIRRSTASTGESLSDIDAEVTFEETSRVLTGLSRGSEAIVECSLVIASTRELELDPHLFIKETYPELSLAAVSGLRSGFHRSHWIRVATASDLISSIGDPEEQGVSILRSFRDFPLYFSPQDERLEALHWLVVGASGSGKSFFTGLVLKRLIEQGTAMSVLFVDHNRSFRRVVRESGGRYFEPKTLTALMSDSAEMMAELNRQGSLVGIELSDLSLEEKKSGIGVLLSRVETFLRCRDTTYPVYLVLDECWNFLRDEPLLVQRAFREFRKLNGAAIAITQSLSDFLTDESGQSIFQNAPIRILLRQGEDLGRYQGALALNSVELARVRMLQQKKGVFSECLIKTPFLSRFGRLYPSPAEHDLLRTDTIRAELIEEQRRNRAVVSHPRGGANVQL